MLAVDPTTIERFKENSKTVGAKVVELENLEEAIAYALDVCEQKEFRELLLSDPKQKDCPRAEDKIIAAPDLDDPSFNFLNAEGQKRGFGIIRTGMREHLSGIDIGLNIADLAVAEIATCILCSGQEDSRLAGMLSEIQIIILPKLKIVDSLYETEDYLRELMRDDSTYISFIAGPSRTADIERVLTLGVQGPLELHVALLPEPA